MTQAFKSALSRSAGTLLGDALGAASLMVLLFVGLCLPIVV